MRSESASSTSTDARTSRRNVYGIGELEGFAGLDDKMVDKMFQHLIDRDVRFKNYSTAGLPVRTALLRNVTDDMAIAVLAGLPVRTTPLQTRRALTVGR